MPEMKRNFTKGKMNMDLDERLVPNGEYKLAQNIQVHSNEEGDVGTVNSIPSNMPGCAWGGEGDVLNINNPSNPIKFGSNTVGSIADEKNDTLFWLVSGRSYNTINALVDDNTHPLNGNTTEVIDLSDVLPLRRYDADNPVFDSANQSRRVTRHIDALRENNEYVPITLKDMIMSHGYIDNYLNSPESNKSLSKNLIFSQLKKHNNGTKSPDQLPWIKPCRPILVDKYGYITVNNTVGQTDVIVLTPDEVVDVTSGMVVSGYEDLPVDDSGTTAGRTDQVPGCTDPSANNYDPSFKVDCNGHRVGSELYQNLEGWNSCCSYDVDDVVGCTDENANNYNPEATFDNGSCNYGPIVADQIDLSTPYYVSSSPITFFNMLILDVNYETGQIFLNGSVDLTTTHTLHFSSKRVLNFHKTRLITGINIVDNMLFWTDNYSEPKKINILNSFIGTHSSGLYHTQLVTSNTLQKINSNATSLTDLQNAINNAPPIREEHITVIKKSPKNQLTLSFDTGRDIDKTYAGTIVITSTNGDDNILFPVTAYDFSSITSNDGSNYMRVEIPTNYDGDDEFELERWKVGSKVVLKEWSDDNIAPTLPINDFTIKGRIVGWGDNKFTATPGDPAKVAIEVDMVSGNPPLVIGNNSTRNYTIDLFDESEKLFEFKFPRFSYRYKYSDGEYSTYAPFSDVAFVPGGYKFDSKVGYNLGMTNTVNSITIENFISNDIPDDIVGIDLLYKEDSSPNIYVVDTIKPLDEVPQGQTENNWDKNKYVVTSDVIHAVLPSNQLLRPWDNVPRKALAQEVTGSRIVYGNYLQNFNLNNPEDWHGIINSSKLVPSFKHSLMNYYSYPDQDDSTIKSIKSLRNYQLGVVFVDKYGRETPVLTNETASFKTNKEDSITPKKIRVGFRGQVAPRDMSYFKFFIKETSGEYYNLAMDRFYEAEDDGLWLAFPSSDRNKIDIDTYLILKKGTDSENVVKDQARYKILAIENEAPDFIKTTYNNIGEILHVGGGGASTSDPYGTSLDDAPRSGATEFSAINDKFTASSLKDIDKIVDTLYVEFQIQTEDYVSDRYEISSVTHTEDSSGASDGRFNFKLKDSFNDEIDYFNDGVKIRPSVVTRIIRGKVENKAQFDGRFFVKIYKDDVFLDNISGATIEENVDYRVAASKKIFLLATDHFNRHNGTSKQSTTSKYNESVYPSSSYGWVTGSNDKWNVDGGEDHMYTLNDEDLTWKWSAFRSYFKPSKTVDELGGDQLYFYKWEMKNEIPANSNRHGQIGDRVGEGDLLNWNANNKYEDVFFIDKGPYVATGRNNAINQTGTSWNVNYTSGSGMGITNWDEEGRMDLGFGPLEPDNLWDNHNNYWYSWGDGTQNGRSSYSKYDSFFKKTTSGSQFRWKEDPSGTVYTVFKSWEQKNRKRYGQNKLPQDYDDPISIAFGNDYYTNGPYFDGSNNTPVSRFHFFPAMTAWEPTRGGGNSNEGIIGGTKTINKYALYDTTAGTATATDITGTWGVDFVEINNNIFENTIDTNYFPGNINNLDGISNKTEKIEVGMILYDVGGAKPGGTDYGVLVKSIEVGVTKTKIIFEGYNKVTFTTLGGLGSGAMDFRQPSMNGLSVNSAANINQSTGTDFRGIGAVGYTLEFIEPKSRENLLPEDPAIWETEPKESTDLDIYHEASEYNPLSLNVDTIETALPIGSRVYSTAAQGWAESAFSTLQIVQNQSESGDIITLSSSGCTGTIGSTAGGCTAFNTFIPALEIGSVLRITRPSGLSFSIAITEIFQDPDIPNLPVAKTFRIAREIHNGNYWLNWHNCYSFGNGVESNRIRDSFNQPFISNGVVASTTLPDEYKEERRKYGLIYSGIYNSNSGINNLNQFIQAEKITKDINPIYGSIQKLHSRSTADGDLITLCEDRVLKILANKDAVFNADGNTNLVSTENVLGQAIPYAGNYGISKNPESFTTDAYRAYFADTQRKSIIRLSKDGLTPISDFGMRSPFKAMFNGLEFIRGLSNMFSQDPKGGGGIGGGSTYEPAGPTQPAGFFEQASRKKANFTPSMPGFAMPPIRIVGGFDADQNQVDFSFAAIGEPTENITETLGTLPGADTLPQKLEAETNISMQALSPFSLLGTVGVTATFREDVKGWPSLKSYVPEDSISCSGTYYTFQQGNIWRHNLPIVAQKDYFENFLPFIAAGFGGNLKSENAQDNVPMTFGGDVPSSLEEFKFKNTFYGLSTPSLLWMVFNQTPDTIKNFQALSYEGSQAKITKSISYNTFKPGTSVITGTLGDNEYYNLKDKSGWSCVAFKTDLEKATLTEFINKEGKWFNYVKNASQTASKGTHSTYHYDDPEYGAHASFQGLATIALGGVVAGDVYGCTDPNALNYDVDAVMDDGSCIAVIGGCMDPNAFNYDSLANTDDGSCIINGCTDTNAINYNDNANTDDGSCIDELVGCTDSSQIVHNGVLYNYYFNYDPAYNTPCSEGTSLNCPCIMSVFGCPVPTATNYNQLANVDDGTCNYTDDPAQQKCNKITSLNAEYKVDSINYGTFDNAVCLMCGDDTAINYDNAEGCLSKNNQDGATTFVQKGYTSPPFNEEMNPAFCAALSANNLITTEWVKHTKGCEYTPIDDDDDTGLDSEVLFEVSNITNTSVTIKFYHAPITEWQVAIKQLENYIVGEFENVIDINYSHYNEDKKAYFYTFNKLIPSTSYKVALRGRKKQRVSVDGNWSRWEFIDISTETNIKGCIDKKATNYDGKANIACSNCCNYSKTPMLDSLSDTSGCTDPMAYNYNALATLDDESCFYTNPLEGDTNGDGIVNLADLTLVINNWLKDVDHWTNGDTNGDGFVNLADLTLVINNWLKTDAEPSDPGVNTDYKGLVVEQIDNTSGGFTEGEKTYRLYAEFKNQDSKLCQMFAHDYEGINYPHIIQTSQGTTFFNQDFFGDISNLQAEVNAGGFGSVPKLEFDTWCAIGDSYTDLPSTIGEVGLENNLSGNQWMFGQGTARNTTLDFDAAIYRVAADPLCIPDENNRVLLGQFTTSGDVSGTINIGGQLPNGNLWEAKSQQFTTEAT